VHDVISGCTCLAALLLRFDKKTVLPVYVLRNHFYVYRYAKSKQIIGAQFQRLFSTVFLLFDVPEYSNTFDYIKDKRPAVYFNNQKIIAYHL